MSFRTVSCVHCLESRMLFAGISLAGDGILSITGTDSKDAIEVQIRASNPDRVKAELNGSEKTFSKSAIKGIRIEALGGNDSVEIGSSDEPVAISATISGGTGNDNLDGGASGDLIHGNGGRDSIEGEGGNDRLYGDAGNDILQGAGGRDRLFGGSGSDSLQGGSGDDTLDGGPSTDTLEGNAGKDLLTQ